MSKDFMQLTTQDMLPYDFRKKYGAKFNQMSSYADVWQFVIPSLGSKVLHFKTPWHKVEQVRTDLWRFLETTNRTIEQKQADVAGVEKDWQNVREILRGNAGMAQMMLDHGCRSRYLYKVIQTGAQAILLEVFHGQFISVAGEMEHYPYSDPLARYTVNESIAVNIQERTMYAQKVMQSPQQKILLSGAGLCPEVRLYNCPPLNAGHEILAVDMDERNSANLKLVFKRPFADYGIEYLVDDVRNICNNSKYEGYFDAELAQGVLSYYKSHAQTVSMLETLDHLLKPGGTLVFDLQLLRADLLRCATSLSWESDLSPDTSVDSAVKRVMTILRDQMGYRVWYDCPKYHNKPVAVFFRAVKPL